MSIASTEAPSKTSVKRGKAKPKSSSAQPSRRSTAARSEPVSSPQPLVSQWLQMSRKELDQIYKQAKPGAVPQGDTRGTAILGNRLTGRVFAAIARKLAWQGKVFDLFAPDYNSGVVVNKVLPIGSKLIVAKVYRDKSWMDGKDTTVIDYGSTSLLARSIRDEIREVAPGIYLGKVWLGKRRVLDFALETNNC